MKEWSTTVPEFRPYSASSRWRSADPDLQLPGIAVTMIMDVMDAPIAGGRAAEGVREAREGPTAVLLKCRNKGWRWQ
jgi:hypothetical protein